MEKHLYYLFLCFARLIVHRPIRIGSPTISPATSLRTRQPTWRHGTTPWRSANRTVEVWWSFQTSKVLISGTPKMKNQQIMWYHMSNLTSLPLHTKRFRTSLIYKLLLVQRNTGTSSIWLYRTSSLAPNILYDT